MTVCLDSWAVLAWLQDEAPAAAVDEAMATGRPLISWINLAEVRYLIHRERGERHANSIVNKLRHALDCELPTERRIIEAAIFKAGHAIALADCFAISAAADNDAVLLTGDPEILEIVDLPCAVRDLRA